MNAEPPPGGERAPDLPGRDWAAIRRRAIAWAVVVVALILVSALAAAFLPRWWAQQVAGLVDGRFGRGIGWGLFLGVVFTAAPVLLVARTLFARSVRRWKHWRSPAILAGVGVLLATPNLLTLWVVLGSSGSAHAAERTLDVMAPAFRGATVSGAVIGAAIAVGVDLLWRGWRGRKRDAVRVGE